MHIPIQSYIATGVAAFLAEVGPLQYRATGVAPGAGGSAVWRTPLRVLGVYQPIYVGTFVDQDIW